MIHLFFNALAASAGAGLTYVRNIVPEISSRNDVRATIAVTPTLRREFHEVRNVAFIELEATGTIQRFWKEQSLLTKMIQNAEADVLISAGNFALRKSPVPQILLSGNSLYTSKEFRRDLAGRREYGMMAGNFMRGIVAKKSVAW